jgi:LPXTG-site transpeptidase (sortase) family protein
MNKQQKILLKVFLLTYLSAFLVFNWSDVSWIFNYRAVSGILYDFFNPYPSIEASSFSNLLANNSANYNATDNSPKAEYPYSEKTNTLELPSIEVSVPVILSESTNTSILAKYLDKGVVYYPGSVLPGQNGQIVVLGHSAPPNWPKTKNDWVFSDLNNLNYDDKIFLYFDHKEYVYYVREKKIIDKGQEIIPISLTNNGNILVLVSCWPPGKDYQRIAIYAELVP